MAKSARSFNPELGAKILAHLGDGSPPFYDVAVRRAGAPLAAARWWRRAGLEEFADPDDEQTLFALECERIRAEYVAEKMKTLETANKETAEAARQVQWILTRLDRDMFDTSRPPKEMPKGETAKPTAGRTAQEAADDLANPDLQ